MLGAVMALVVAIITCLKFNGSCVTMLIKHKTAVSQFHYCICLDWAECQYLRLFLQKGCNLD